MLSTSQTSAQFCNKVTSFPPLPPPPKNKTASCTDWLSAVMLLLVNELIPITIQ